MFARVQWLHDLQDAANARSGALVHALQLVFSIFHGCNDGGFGLAQGWNE